MRREGFGSSLSVHCERFAYIISVSHNNFLVVSRKFSSPGLAGFAY